VYVAASTIHTLPLEDDFARVVIKEVRQANAEVSVPTSKVRFVG